LALAGPAAGQEGQPVSTTENLRLPLQHYEDGTLRVQLRAGTASLPPEGLVKATDVLVEFFEPDGTCSGTLRADACEYDRKAKLVTSGAPVKLQREGLHIAGTGFIWKVEEERVEILRDVKVTLKGGLQLEGVLK